MLAVGMPEPPQFLQVNTRNIVRYGPKQRAWYRVHELRDRAGQPVYVGAYGCWGAVDAQRIARDDAREHASSICRADLVAARAAEEQQQRARAERAAARAQAEWRAATVPDGPVGYLARKQVQPHAVRVTHDGVLLVPMLRYDWPRQRALVGLQRIAPDGTKRFLPGTAKVGTAVRIGPAPRGRECILLCEGIATGLSIAMALELARPVFVAFDAGNLAPVAAILRALHAEVALGVCADDDACTAGNPGIRYAGQAVVKLRPAQLLRPRFREPRPPRVTDFNDLHVGEGLDVVRAQLRPFIAFLERM